MDFPTFQDLFRVARDEVLVRSASLTREIVEREGTDANAMTAVGPVVGDELVGQLIRTQAAIFLASAQRADLDKLVFDRYNITRKPATPALGEVDFTTTTPVAVGFNIPINTQLTSEDGTVYVTTAEATFPTASSGPITVAIRSTQAGVSQHARAGTITSFPEAIVGAPADLAVTNPLATSGAGDAETDPELRLRAQLFYTTAFRGTLRAIERGALQTAGVRTTGVFEATNICGDPAGFVQVVVSDQFSETFVKTDTTPAEYEAQSQQLALEVDATLLEFRAGGIFVLVVVGAVTLVPITLSLRIRRGFDTAIVSAQAKAFAQEYTNALKPGEDFVITDLETAISRVPGIEVAGGEVITPTADLVAGATEVFRTSLGLIIVGDCVQV